MTHTCQELDSLSKETKLFQPKTKLTIEKNPTKPLDTKIIKRACELETQVYNNSKKLPGPCFSKIAA